MGEFCSQEFLQWAVYDLKRNIYDRWLLRKSIYSLGSFILPHCKNSWLLTSPIVCIIQLLMFRCVKIHVLNYLDRFGWVWLKSDLPFLDQEIENSTYKGFFNESWKNHDQIMTKSNIWPNSNKNRKYELLTSFSERKVNFWSIELHEKKIKIENSKKISEKKKSIFWVTSKKSWFSWKIEKST